MYPGPGHGQAPREPELFPTRAVSGMSRWVMSRAGTKEDAGASPAASAPVDSVDEPSMDGEEARDDMEESSDSVNPAALDASLPERDFDPPDARAEERERDRLLVERVRAGDGAAFRELFEKYHRRAYSVAYGVVKSKEDALDVVQEAFVKVHKHLDSFQGTSSFYTWLYRIVMNLAIDHLRRRKNGKPVEYDDAISREGDDEAGILPRLLESNPGKTAVRHELMARVEAALATLPEYHRQVIILREIEGMSYEEIAEVMDVPKGTIMSRLFHARRKMQVELQDFADGEGLELEE
jgi:RNA polymerase sigma-70 factor, ECF subfamily